MDIITIEGEALDALLDGLLRYRDLHSGDPHRLRVARDEGSVKFKLDERVWSPPYPEAAEDARRRERERA